jgi:hypothetical protein
VANLPNVPGTLRFLHRKVLVNWYFAFSIFSPPYHGVEHLKIKDAFQDFHSTTKL